jgi:hypothetical protein
MLRAVASELVATQPRVDYFPSYEIITHSAYKGRFFAPNLRSVLPEGVGHVMAQFFHDQAVAFGGEAVAGPVALPPEEPMAEPPVVEAVPDDPSEPELTEAEELRCEEEILAAFAPDQRHE